MQWSPLMRDRLKNVLVLTCSSTLGLVSLPGPRPAACHLQYTWERGYLRLLQVTGSWVRAWE